MGKQSFENIYRVLEFNGEDKIKGLHSGTLESCLFVCNSLDRYQRTVFDIPGLKVTSEWRNNER